MIKSRPFGTLPSGEDISLFELSNKMGTFVDVLNYGGILQSIKTPNRDGKLGHIVLGFDTLEEYVNDTASHGALVGRYANRIAGASFELDGKTYLLAENDGDNCLHGGPDGFNKTPFRSEIVQVDSSDVLRLTHTSPHGHQGFPGALDVTVDYWLTEDNELKINFQVTTTQTTVLNMTMHPYFNLTGDSEINTLDHILEIKSDAFLPVSLAKIPLGERRQVETTPFDFREERRVGSMLDVNDKQIQITQGYDHCFIGSLTPEVLAQLFDPGSGRKMSIRSNMPGIQLYTGNHLSRGIIGRNRRCFVRHGGICLEPQDFPNAPNEPAFPTTVLNVGEVYQRYISYHFSIDE